jgi:hypothetical protein
MAAQGKRKSQQRGSRFRSRQRLKAIGLALGVAMAITMGLLSLVSSTTAPKAEAGAGHVTRHLRGLLLNQVARGHGMAMEAQGTKSRAVAMEALVTRKAGKGDATMAPSTSTSTTNHERTGIITMEALPLKTSNWMSSPDTVAEEEATAEEAKEIAEEAMRVGLRAEEHAQAAEAAAELSIITQVGMATGEQISIFDEIEDSKDSQDSEEKAAKFKKDQGW